MVIPWFGTRYLKFDIILYDRPFDWLEILTHLHKLIVRVHACQLIQFFSKELNYYLNECDHHERREFTQINYDLIQYI